MERIRYEGTSGSFPVIGVWRDTDASEPVDGRIAWNAVRSDSGEDHSASVSVYLDGEINRAFVPSQIDLSRELVRRLGEYDRDAHGELVGKLDWKETRGFDVRPSCDSRVHATRGSVPFTGKRLGKDGVEDMQGNVLWTALGSDKGAEKRLIRATLFVPDDGGYLPSDEDDVDCGLVGRLAEEDRDAMESLVEKMDWTAEGFENWTAGGFEIRLH